MADWSQLPTELLQIISKKLNNSELYLLRFRSVCSNWRSSVPNYRQNHLQLLKFSNPTHNASAGYLIQHNIFLIKPPKTPNQQTLLRPWLIRIGPNLNGKIHLYKPLYLHHPLSFNLPVLDFNQLSVVELGHTFYIMEDDSLETRYNNVYPKKVVAATCHEEQPLHIVTYNIFGHPMMFRCGDNSWASFLNNKSEFFFGDICIFKGRPCVVDKTGLTVMIRPDLSIHLLADPFCEVYKFKSLVESDGELLLVDIYSSNGGLRMIDVFRLDEKEKKWVKLTTLGDRVLFLGCGSSFSASASDLGVSNGNCVIFNDDSSDCELGVFHLDQGQVSPLSDYPDYFKLFWPPPEWILELHS